MKQTFVLLLTLMLILTASVAVAQLGRAPCRNFTVVNENGTLTALSGLLQTKKAVLLHFFAGWLDEDYSDLPAVQAAYAQYGRISALSSSAWRNRKPCKALPPRGRRTS